jgi:uncharacterized membrane protein YqaE (UPF0057 family)
VDVVRALVSLNKGNKVDNKLLLIILSIFLPPVAVFMKKGGFDTDVIINIVLCFLMFLPAIIHALWITTR